MIVNNEKVKHLVSQYSDLQRIRSPYEIMWQDIVDYVAPRYYDLYGTELPGSKVGELMYDGTITGALRIWVDGFYGYMVSQAYRWFSLTIPLKTRWPGASVMRKYNGKRLDDIPEVRQWLQDVEECLYNAFRRSNFYESIKQYIYDGGTIGTANLYSEEDVGAGKIVYTVCHPGECYIAEDRYGRVDTLFRRLNYTSRQMEQKWGKEALPTTVKQDLENNNTGLKEWTLIHAVQPRKDADPNRLDSRNMPVSSIYIMEKGDENVILNESGYKMMPYSTWRTYKVSREVYGRSPSSECLIDIISSHTLSKDLLAAAEGEVYKPWLAPEQLRGKIDRTPWGITYYDLNMEKKGPFGPVDTRSNYPVGVDREERLSKRIEDHFNVGFFLTLSRMEGDRRTATEIMETQGEKAVLLGSAVGSFTSQCLDPQIDRAFTIEQEADRLPPPPQVLVDYQGANIETDYLGPLSQAQKRLFRTQGIQAGLTAITPIASVNNKVLNIINWDKTARETLEAAGFPASCINDEEKTEALNQEMDKRAAEEAAMAYAERAGKAIPGLSKGPEKGSPMDAMTGGQNQGGGA